jgi:hypothetical protein
MKATANWIQLCLLFPQVTRLTIWYYKPLVKDFGPASNNLHSRWTSNFRMTIKIPSHSVDTISTFRTALSILSSFIHILIYWITKDLPPLEIDVITQIYDHFCTFIAKYSLQSSHLSLQIAISSTFNNLCALLPRLKSLKKTVRSIRNKINKIQFSILISNKSLSDEFNPWTIIRSQRHLVNILSSTALTKQSTQLNSHPRNIIV